MGNMGRNILIISDLLQFRGINCSNNAFCTISFQVPRISKPNSQKRPFTPYLVLSIVWQTDGLFICSQATHRTQLACRRPVEHSSVYRSTDIIFRNELEETASMAGHRKQELGELNCPVKATKGSEFFQIIYPIFKQYRAQIVISPLLSQLFSSGVSYSTHTLGSGPPGTPWNICQEKRA